jgi:glycosyltransferase involved in cell wall biosynthesis
VAKAKKTYISVTNDLFTDQRVRKVCEFLVANGFEVTLVGRKLKDSQDMPADLKYKTKRFPLWFKKGPKFYATYNLRLFFYLLFRKADLLISNDLDTLYANHWARKFKGKCPLIYDSHEYYCGTPELESRPKVQKFWRKIEKRCLPKVDAMYTVNESIADLYREEYKREVKVVRNITDGNLPPLDMTRKHLGLPIDKKVVIMQGAGINIDRGGEEMIAAIQKVDNAVLAIVGDGDVVPELKAKVDAEGWGDKVLFFGKRPYHELMNFTALSDVGISLDKDSNINYRFSLPNKIFDYIHAGIPLMVSELKEVAAIVRGYEVGVVCASHDIDDIVKTLNDLLKDEAALNRYKENTKQAALALNWNSETEVLKEIYLTN